MAVEVTIIVTDSPPLVTLAVAQSLDYLLYPELPVIIPDAVFYEATGTAGKLGAQEILEWYRAHSDRAQAGALEPSRRHASGSILAEHSIAYPNNMNSLAGCDSDGKSEDTA